MVSFAVPIFSTFFMNNKRKYLISSIKTEIRYFLICHRFVSDEKSCFVTAPFFMTDILICSLGFSFDFIFIHYFVCTFKHCIKIFTACIYTDTGCNFIWLLRSFIVIIQIFGNAVSYFRIIR